MIYDYNVSYKSNYSSRAKHGLANDTTFLTFVIVPFESLSTHLLYTNYSLMSVYMHAYLIPSS